MFTLYFYKRRTLITQFFPLKQLDTSSVLFVYQRSDLRVVHLKTSMPNSSYCRNVLCLREQDFLAVTLLIFVKIDTI